MKQNTTQREREDGDTGQKPTFTDKRARSAMSVRSRDRALLCPALLLAAMFGISACLSACEKVPNENIVFPPAPVIDYVETHGRLQVSDARLRDESGNAVQLKGMSTYWLNWESGEKFAKKEVVTALVKEWGISILRIAVGVNPGDGSGYTAERNRADLLAIVRVLADACIDNGIYFIVDWHSYDTLYLADLEADFFSGIAEEYGEYPNLMYELYNEPGEFESWSGELKPYQEKLVRDVIRPVDPDNVIIIGSRAWDQHAEECADDPIVADNLVYSFHFYAAGPGHRGAEAVEMRKRYEYAMAKGLALFATEWGPGHWDWTKNAIDEHEANLWVSWMNAHSIGWANWSICDLAEASSALMPGTPPTGGWTSDDLTSSGVYIRRKLLE